MKPHFNAVTRRQEGHARYFQAAPNARWVLVSFVSVSCRGRYRLQFAYDHGHTGNCASPNYLGILRSQNFSAPSGGHNNVHARILLYISKPDEIDAFHVVQNFIKQKRTGNEPVACDHIHTSPSRSANDHRKSFLHFGPVLPQSEIRVPNFTDKINRADCDDRDTQVPHTQGNAAPR